MLGFRALSLYNDKIGVQPAAVAPFMLPICTLLQQQSVVVDVLTRYLQFG